MLKIITLIFFCLLCSFESKAALPFVTDDAFIQNQNQLTLETFAERWSLPAKTELNKNKTTLYSYFLSGSYGLTKHLELSMAGNIGYDIKDHAASFMNPMLQLKAKILESENHAIPALAIDFGYVNHNGKGEYFDPATNYYGIAAATSRFFNDDLILHINLGKKASLAVPNGPFYRTHLGVGIDFALVKKFRGVIESYNGAQNSPRDSPGYFHSYQAGIKWIKSDHFSLYSIYGTQPTFAGSDDNGVKFYRNTSWIQVGARFVFDSLL